MKITLYHPHVCMIFLNKLVGFQFYSFWFYHFFYSEYLGWPFIFILCVFSFWESNDERILMLYSHFPPYFLCILSHGSFSFTSFQDRMHRNPDIFSSNFLFFRTKISLMAINWPLRGYIDEWPWLILLHEFLYEFKKVRAIKSHLLFCTFLSFYQ